jgi:uncharacterized protein with HEPN domain
VSRDPGLYLEDMQTACDKILRYTEGMTFDEFTSDERTYDAVIRNIEILGEAAKNISDDIKAKYTHVEWRAIAALRNIVAHAYFSVKDEIIWDVVCNKITPLRNQVELILSEIE